jgi:hypothetical protein
MNVRKSVLSRPWVAFGTVRGSCGELLGVEAGDGGAWCHCDETVGSADVLEEMEHVQLSPSKGSTHYESLSDSYREARRGLEAVVENSFMLVSCSH